MQSKEVRVKMKKTSEEMRGRKVLARQEGVVGRSQEEIAGEIGESFELLGFRPHRTVQQVREDWAQEKEMEII
jgi:hypothetical protein